MQRCVAQFLLPYNYLCSMLIDESQNIEYKEAWHDEYLKWICGFANAQGGRIYLGVNDKKEIIGVEDAKRLMEDIPNKIVNYLGVVEDVNLLKADGKQYIKRVYDHSVELWNYGLLPKELTTADLLKKHSSYPRNHNIANVFYKAGFVESWGRGFRKISEEFEKAKLPFPTIEENGGGVMAVVQRRTVEDIIQKNDEIGKVTRDSDENGVEVIELSNRQRLILSIIVKQPIITAKQMAVMTDIPQRTIERELSTLQRLDIVYREGSNRAGNWVIKTKTLLL